MRKSEVSSERLEVAARLRQIRISTGLTQEKFAEILEISLSAYKKIESAENQISLEGIRKLQRELNVSSDYLLFGKYESVDDIWKMIVNCSENDKMLLMLRLISYFSKAKEVKYCIREEQTGYDGEILNILREMDI